jgi:hypothetical protein
LNVRTFPISPRQLDFQIIYGLGNIHADIRGAKVGVLRRGVPFNFAIADDSIGGNLNSVRAEQCAIVPFEASERKAAFSDSASRRSTFLRDEFDVALLKGLAIDEHGTRYGNARGMPIATRANDGKPCR